ncbi:MAG: hypothetical protein ACREFY_16930, partial [Acetobacteraceae bacterium]
AVEVKKPAGKWEKLAGAAYPKVAADPETGWPQGLGLDALPGLSMLMRDNKDSMAFDRMASGPKS